LSLCSIKVVAAGKTLCYKIAALAKKREIIIKIARKNK
jgi:hypothetical protein